MTVVPRLSGLIDRTLVSVTSAVSASVAHEAAGAGREAAIPLVGADHHERRTLAAARDADGELGALQSAHEWALQGRLDDLTGSTVPIAFGQFISNRPRLTAVC